MSETTADGPAPAVSTEETGSRTATRRHRSGGEQSFTRTVVQWVGVIVVALIIAVLLKTFVVEAFAIPSGSMEPTIDVGDRVLVDKLSYDFGGHPEAGQIVVFSRPADFYEYDSTEKVNDLIKRVVGTPGESLRSGPGPYGPGTIYVDGKPLAEPWLSAEARTAAGDGPAICSQNRTDCVGQTLHLPVGEYLVEGDNRGDSTDGRIFGPIPGHLILGRAFVRIWPLSRFHWF